MITREEAIKAIRSTTRPLPSLKGVDLRYANLNHADLSNAILTNANLSHTNLFNADLSNSDLTDADLSDADISNANLSNTNLSNTKFGNTNVNKNTDFTDAGFDNVKINSKDRKHLLEAFNEHMLEIFNKHIRATTAAKLNDETGLKTMKDYDLTKLDNLLSEAITKLRNLIDQMKGSKTTKIKIDEIMPGDVVVATFCDEMLVLSTTPKSKNGPMATLMSLDGTTEGYLMSRSVHDLTFIRRLNLEAREHLLEVFKVKTI